MKYKVMIIRREIYTHEEVVEADDPMVAEDMVRRAYYNDEYGVLDCMDDVQTDFEVDEA